MAQALNLRSIHRWKSAWSYPHSLVRSLQSHELSSWQLFSNKFFYVLSSPHVGTLHFNTIHSDMRCSAMFLCQNSLVFCTALTYRLPLNDINYQIRYDILSDCLNSTVYRRNKSLRYGMKCTVAVGERSEIYDMTDMMFNIIQSCWNLRGTKGSQFGFRNVSPTQPFSYVLRKFQTFWLTSHSFLWKTVTTAVYSILHANEKLDKKNWE